MQDDRGIDADIIAQQIIEVATEAGETENGLWMDSNAGNFMSKVAVKIQQDDSILRVSVMVFDCLPTSLNALRSDQRVTVELLNTASSILPDIATHPLVEYLYAQQQLQESSLQQGGGYSVEKY